jgi:glycosyltransferase involved in cell wall biosynthesis
MQATGTCDGVERQSMVICKIWDADYPWDVRVEKVCQSLGKKHEVHLICRNNLGRARYQEADGIHIHRLPSIPRNRGWLTKLVGFPAFFNPVWILVIWRVVRRYRANIILVRDLPLALAAVLVGCWMNIPVILDMAENYPAMIEDLWQKNFRLINVVVRNPAFVRLVEKICVRYVDHVLVVVEESRQRLINLGVRQEKISLVMNTPTFERFNKATAGGHLALTTKRRENLTIIYVGLLEWPRGLETAIHAICEVQVRLPNIRLVIVGSGRDHAYFEALVAKLNLAHRVQFVGWLDYRKAIEFIASADIGLVPHHATASWNSTIPNKLFDYMSMAKPVIVSNAAPTARIVREENCGVVFPEKDFERLGDAIVKLSAANVRAELGRRGKEAVLKKYNWSADEERLLRAVEKVARTESSGQCVELSA